MGSRMSSSKPWLYFLYAIFPLPMVFLVLLSLPLPERFRYSVRRILLRFLDSILFLRIGFNDHSMSVIVFIIIVALIGFMLSIQETWNLHALELKKEITWDKDAVKGKRWRAERNFWISLLGLLLWIILYRVRGLLKEADRLNESRTTTNAPDEEVNMLRKENQVLKDENKKLKEQIKKLPSQPNKTSGLGLGLGLSKQKDHNE